MSNRDPYSDFFPFSSFHAQSAFVSRRRSCDIRLVTTVPDGLSVGRSHSCDLLISCIVFSFAL